MHLEIELQSPMANEEIYELRNYLQENLEGISLHIKALPAQEGQMVVDLLAPVLGGVIEAVVGLTLHQIYDQKLKPKIDAWLSIKKPQGNSNLGVLSTLKQDDTKIHFLENSSGETKVYDNVNYAIDTDKTHAILIGSGDFEGGFSSIPPVQGNLEDLYRLLTDKLHVGLPPENVVIAHNKSNTEIEEILLRNSRLPNMETLLIYFAGHGHRTDIKKLYLIARNTRKIDDYILGGIDFDFINHVILKSSTAKQKILILDACHSGIATQGTDPMITDIDVKGTYTLTSSSADDVSYFDKNNRNTYFTGMLLDVMKNGIDNTNQMLALDDLFDYAQEHLKQKNFPHPISKSQLNIPPSKFFIARNPLFSLEKLKRRPGELFRQGKFQDALYEYELLLQKYPDDLNLRKEAENCRSQALFTQLVNDADELFYQHHNYPAALEKYRKASYVKQDDMVMNKIQKCEERIGASSSTKGSDGNVNDLNQKSDDTVVPKSNLPKQEQSTKNTPPPIQSSLNLQDKESQSDQSVQRVVPANKVALVVAVSWLIIVTSAFFISMFISRYFLSLGILAGTGLVLAFRYRKMSGTEFLIYGYAALPGLYWLVGHFSKYSDRWFISLLLILLTTFFYFKAMKKKSTSFNTIHYVAGSLALIFLSSMAGAVVFFGFTRIVLQSINDTFTIAGGVFGCVVGIVLIINMIRKKQTEIARN